MGLTSWFRRNHRRAVFTVVRDESVFLPVWLGYYSRHFTPGDIFVFDHRTTDGSVAAARREYGFQWIPVDHEVFNDFPWYTAFVQDRQRELLDDYDVVVFTEADEILWHRAGLRQYLTRFDRDAIRATGFNVWHDRESEADLDLRGSILGQRRYWVRNPEYDKPLVTRVPLSYEFGFHECAEGVEKDPDLLLLHLHTMDYRIGLAKHHRTRAYRDYAAASLERRFGFQGRLVGEEYARWFDEQGASDRRQMIPEALASARPI